MNELALFCGVGGGALASELLGDTIVCAVERDAYAAAILAQRQNDGALPLFPIWSDVCTFDGRPWRGLVDVVSGGFPCQDVSVAGTGDGLDGARSGLWREMVRIIREVEPGIVRVENSPMLASRGLTRVLGDLAAMGFDAEWDVVSAADLDAWHLRERLWLVAAHPDRLRELQRQGRESAERRRPGDSAQAHADADGFMRDSGTGAGRQDGPEADDRSRKADADTGGGQHGAQERQVRAGRYAAFAFGRWPAEPAVVRMVHGLPHRVDRIKCLGNAQVPRVAAAAFAALAAELE